MSHLHLERWSDQQAALVLGIKRSTLAKWRCLGTPAGLPPLPYSKAGRRVFYTPADVEAFAAIYVVKHDGKGGAA
ncbi:helix-turn-helix domain-containing protein [Chitinilyticum litopenaei]|uniref:helix-turn-helix domain-containing protein n=1 Tax=Chitinilyticum litopenaei TaxID=1121276 RepID=UPI001184D903|nr:helix-turn-helix domain-containing protein [Chitinilyticum litopenaei]